MAKELTIVSESGITRTVRKGVFTGKGNARKQVGTVDVLEIKPATTSADIAKWITRHEAPIASHVVACYNYGSDLLARQARVCTSPLVLRTSIVKIRGVEVNLLKLPVAKAKAMIAAAKAYSEETGAKVPERLPLRGEAVGQRQEVAPRTRTTTPRRTSRGVFFCLVQSRTK